MIALFISRKAIVRQRFLLLNYSLRHCAFARLYLLSSERDDEVSDTTTDAQGTEAGNIICCLRMRKGSGYINNFCMQRFGGVAYLYVAAAIGRRCNYLNSLTSGYF
jgi:hypothetical protein